MSQQDPQGTSAEDAEAVESVEAVEAERTSRLDPDNRPDNVEVDNTDRTFDPERGLFTDSEGYDEAPKKFPPLGEQTTEATPQKAEE